MRYRDVIELPEERIDLGRAALLLATIESPELDVDAWLGRLDEMGAAVRERAEGTGGDYERLGALIGYLYGELGLRGNTEDYYDPRNSFLDRAPSGHSDQRGGGADRGRSARRRAALRSRPAGSFPGAPRAPRGIEDLERYLAEAGEVRIARRSRPWWRRLAASWRRSTDLPGLQADSASCYHHLVGWPRRRLAHWRPEMARTLNATFDGAVLRLDEPLQLPPNTRVRVTVEAEERSGKEASFLATARSLRLEGPPDWSSRLEDYLYGDVPAEDG